MAPAVVAAGEAALLIDIAQTALIQVVGQAVAGVIGSAFAPELLELQQESFRLTNTRALDPAISVDAYIKGHRSQADSMNDVAAQGYSGDLWQAMAESAGEPLPLLILTEAWRRGFIPKTGLGGESISLEQGIRESRLKNKWTDVVEKLQFSLPPVGTIIEGWLRAQITPEQALDLAYKSGVDKDTATLMFKAAGRPPSPQELLELWRRGEIPEKGTGGDSISVDQGYLETDLKDKWLETWKKLRRYLPPPRIVTTLLREGAITEAQAKAYFTAAGLEGETLDAYLASAHHQRSATTKELTKAEWVAMYTDQAITSDELTKRLLTLGFSADDAALEVQLADLKVRHALEQRAVNRVGTLYVGRRIEKAQAMTTLQSLKLPAKQIDRLLAVWGLERADNLKHLTSTVLAWAVKEGIMDGEGAVEELTRQGYGPRDAWLELSYHLKAPVTQAVPSDNLPPA